MASLRVVVAPDSFKSTLTAVEASDAIADGWRAVRPDDTVTTLPLADGGEGTLDVIHRATPGSVIRRVGEVSGPTGQPTPGHYVALDADTALVELAVSSGLPLLDAPDPLGATTAGLGETMRHAIDHGHTKILVALGGSASTDAGLGALVALGLVATNADGQPVARGGGALGGISSLDSSFLIRPTAGVVVLRDTTATFLEAPSVFGPQKGASKQDIDALTHHFHHLLALTGDTTYAGLPGSGAAGGTGWGFARFLDAQLVGGAGVVSELVGLPAALDNADLVITGEGRFDQTSLIGKVTGEVISDAHDRGLPVGLIVGVDDNTASHTLPVVSLTEQAGSPQAAIAEPKRFAYAAAMRLAQLIQEG